MYLLAAIAATGGGVALSGARPAVPPRPDPPAQHRKAAAADTGQEPPGAAVAAPRQAVATLERFAGVNPSQEQAAAPATTAPATKAGAGATAKSGAGADRPSAAARDARTARDRAAGAVEKVLALGYARVHVLLATVPDPRDSRLVKAFDDHVAAMRVALERAGFVDDRFYDPWSQTAADEAGARPPYREQPGLLLFRRTTDGGDRELMVLLLVGETSTWGIHRRALETALDVADGVLASPGAAADAAAGPHAPAAGATAGPRGPAAEIPTLHLLGPSMSGAADSLRTTIAGWFRDRTAREAARDRSGAGGATRPFDLEIISGSASSARNQKTLGDDLTADVRRAWPAFTSTFHATIHADQDVVAFVIHFLRRRLHIGSIAFLTESGTAYGGQFVSDSSREASLREEQPQEQPQEQQEQKQSGDQASHQPPGLASQQAKIINVAFPLHVSRLRSEYERQRSPAAERVGEGAPKRLLALERDDDVGADDSFPAKSHVTQSASELSLEQGLHAIATEDVRAVVIVATDAEDQRFLAEKVRGEFPNVTVVIPDADLLGLHDQLHYMEGVLVASTYPLSPWAQRISFPFDGDHDRLPFATSGAEGVYNATLFLIDDIVDVKANADVRDYGSPFDLEATRLSPPLWMTVISRGSYWPVAVADGSNGLGYVQEALPIPDAVHTGASYQTAWTPPHSFTFLLATAILALLDLLLICGYVRAQRGVPAGDRTSGRVFDLLLRPVIFTHKAMQRIELAVLLLLFAVVNAAFAAAGVFTALPVPPESRALWWTLAAACALPTPVLLGLFFHALATWRDPDEPHAAALAVVVALLATGGLVAAAWSRLHVLAHAAQRGPAVAQLMFLLERARNLDSGVSPLWTAALLAGAHALWSLGHLRQVRIVEDAAVLRRLGVVPSQRPAATELPQPPRLLDVLHLAEPMRAAVAEAEGVLPSRLGCGLMALVTIDCLWISRRMVSLEGPFIGWAFAAAYAFLLALLVFGCVRLVRTWRALEVVLAAVAPLPITDALRRIPGKLLTSFKRPWDARVFQVWQRHCAVVFARLRDENTGPHWRNVLEIAPDGTEPLLAAPVALQIAASEAAAPTPPAPAQGSAPAPAADDWSRAWEDFLAMRLVAFVQYIRGHISNFVAVVTATLLPTMWVSGVYPLRGNRFLLMLVLAVAGAAVTATTVVFVQMSRNYVLSRLARSRPGHVTWDRDFVTSLLIHVAIPVFALLAVKFPELGRTWAVLRSTLAAVGGS